MSVGNGAKNIITDEMADIGINPVSYTHLDVYKRQKLNGETISICWSLYEGGGDPDYDALIIRNDDGLDRKLKSAEREQLSDVLDYGFKLYNTVYR